MEVPSNSAQNPCHLITRERQPSICPHSDKLDNIEIPNHGTFDHRHHEDYTEHYSGLAYFEYRRHLFLAGLAPPTTLLDQPLPEYYVVAAELPEPLPLPANRPTPDLSIGRIEKLLVTPGAIESEDVWRNGIRGVYRSLSSGKKLARPLSLGLVVRPDTRRLVNY